MWDAAKIFCAHLCITAAGSGYGSDDASDCDGHSSSSSCSCKRGVCGGRLRGKRVLEIGAGVASLGLCAAALGASEVLCTDYDEQVLQNLEFNLKHNTPTIYPLEESSSSSPSSATASQYNTKLKWSKLDWRTLAADDVVAAEWTATGEEIMKERHQGSSDKNASDYDANIVLGSALVYSAEGALYCADTVRHFLAENKCTEECWILQMPGRPGFDRFLLRLDYWGLCYESFDISQDAFRIAVENMGKINADIDDFKLYVIKRQK